MFELDDVAKVICRCRAIPGHHLRGHILSPL
jgi:hypothetical protein